jgi:predicted HAD superfamily Cof-like phosphohydrolase
MSIYKCELFRGKEKTMSLTNAQAQITVFHENVCGLSTYRYPRFLPNDRANLRASLIIEESGEMVQALLKDDMVGIVDGACDLIVVALGTICEMGIDIEPAWEAVNRANMAKIGGPVRADGKKLKPTSWQPPNIKGAIQGLLEMTKNGIMISPFKCTKCGFTWSETKTEYGTTCPRCQSESAVTL